MLFKRGLGSSTGGQEYRRLSEDNVRPVHVQGDFRRSEVSLPFRMHTHQSVE